MRVRSGRKIWLVALMVFVAVFLFTFLTAKFKDNTDVEAANLANFDPGYIISDYQMGNYNSMSEAEIWNFLKQKGNCNDTRIWQTGNNLGYLSESAPYSWHVSDGHYVCLADENFSGESAAHIIWQAAQDYRINPQVLIVLLQKEQGLITDSFPNSVQYRSATGYGCPDTAACSSRYYGFKNQVRNAAALFRTVLDGGWTNYPLGNNYIQYNPNSGCGGSWVNIRSLATSALYRYTPYQPNSAALAAGYGSGDSCGAYGNRNFYSYFEDWFGGVTREGVVYVQLDTSRFMVPKNDGNFVNPLIGRESEEKFYVNEPQMFTTKTFYNGEWCLRTREDTEIGAHKCVPLSMLDNLLLSYTVLSDQEQYKIVKSGASKLSPVDKKVVFDRFKTNSFRRFIKYFVYDGKKYYVTESDDSVYAMPLYGFTEDELVSLGGYEKTFKYLETTCEPKVKIDFTNGNTVRLAANGRIARLFTASVIYNGQRYYITDNDNRYEMLPLGISEECLEGANHYVSFDTPREMVVKKDTYSYDPGTNSIYGFIGKGKIIYFDEKIKIGDKWYFRSRYNSERGLDIAVPATYLGNV